MRSGKLRAAVALADQMRTRLAQGSVMSLAEPRRLEVIFLRFAPEESLNRQLKERRGRRLGVTFINTSKSDYPIFNSEEQNTSLRFLLVLPSQPKPQATVLE